ncbi:Ig-like domain-containing protein [Paraferrimonas sedimenticola]|uniref:Big-1 domain-containing protein n=1 Tax=Paraferrimonas sedimenticola TaxID=375674 RepID=A0AA37VSM0_9GAMM|nr:invasin domain 3-containing protein [Paraferrimonas sedimenticola]GLP94914.1 hypothetical protein GCM10007895_02200 [Paraferrimonas sedimenticola]
MKSVVRLFSVMCLSLFLAACGGSGNELNKSGDGDGNVPGPSTPEASLTLTLVDSEGNSINEVSSAAPGTLEARLSVDSGSVASQLISFSTETVGSLFPGVGTALTDEQGVARITLRAGTVAGAGKVSASYSSGEMSASAEMAFNSAGDDAGGGEVQIALSLTDGAGNPIEAITANSPGRLVATVTGIAKPTIVTFKTTKGNLPIDTAVTNDEGLAWVDIYAGSDLGAGVVTATLASGESGDSVVVIGATDVQMGSGNPFASGQAEVSIAQLSAGGTATVTVSIVDEAGNPFSQPVDVNFSSGCSSASSPKASLSSPVTTVAGVATSTYLAQGCVGEDPINVTANAGGINLSASAVIEVLASDVGSISFVSAEPENISILGTGGVEASTVKFKVLDQNGNPVSNQSVSFSLNTEVGGIALQPTQATTNDQGVVQTVINSGTVATSVRVTASVDGSTPEISTQSNLLVVSTGIPDQDSFSLSAEVLNAEGWDYDGTQVVITARLADAYNNPVNDGTAVSFTTEGGSIEPSCQTVKGTCSVTWTSQNPRPDGNSLFDNVAHEPNILPFMGQSYGGRATITATAIGEEAFPDLNGNGRFDASEMTAFLGNDVGGQPYDLDEAFVDHNEDGVFNPQMAGGETGGENETLIDFNSNGVFDTKDGKYNGVLCSIPAHDGCSSTQTSTNVRASIVMVMSGSTAIGSAPQIWDDGGAADEIDIISEGTATVSLVISDLHNQQLPAGTKISFSATAGSVVSKSSFDWPSTNYNGGREFAVLVKGEKDPNSGVLIVEAETPKGLVTVVASIPINIVNN